MLTPAILDLLLPVHLALPEYIRKQMGSLPHLFRLGQCEAVEERQMARRAILSRGGAISEYLDRAISASRGLDAADASRAAPSDYDSCPTPIPDLAI